MHPPHLVWHPGEKMLPPPSSRDQKRMSMHEKLAFEFHEQKMKYLKEEHNMKMRILQVELDMKLEERAVQRKMHERMS